MSKERTFLAVRTTGKLGLRINVEGLTVDVTAKMTPEERVFHNQMMGSEAYRKILIIFAQEGVNLRSHEKWGDAVMKGAHLGDTVLK